MTLTNWIYTIKTLLRSLWTRAEIRQAILDHCLLHPQKVMGVYAVDDEKVWEYFNAHDHSISAQLTKHNIRNVYDLLGYFEEVQYKNMRSTYPSNSYKKG